MNVFSLTGKGQRIDNQDVVLVKELRHDTHLLLIADGMGGYKNGCTAAKMASDSIYEFLLNCQKFDETTILKSLNNANLAIKQYSNDNEVIMGTTIGGVVINGKSIVSFWVGDVRILFFRNNKLEFESNPHSLMNDILISGSIKYKPNAEKYKDIVMSALKGDIQSTKIDFKLFDNYLDGDKIIVLSDGAFNTIGLNEIENSLNIIYEGNEIILNFDNILKANCKDNFSIIFIEL